MPGSHSDSPEYIAIGDAARMLSVSVGTFRRWERDGRITALRTPTGHRRFRRVDVEALLASEPSA